MSLKILTEVFDVRWNFVNNLGLRDLWWCYLRTKPLVPSGPRGVRITRTPRGGGEGNTPAAVAPGGSRASTFFSLPLLSI